LTSINKVTSAASDCNRLDAPGASEVLQRCLDNSQACAHCQVYYQYQVWRSLATQLLAATLTLASKSVDQLFEEKNHEQFAFI
jgi:hypothetical protein